jgi:diguanylate cyclase (GGDEF)-like protein
MEHGRIQSLPTFGLWVLTAGMAAATTAVVRFALTHKEPFAGAVRVPWVLLVFAFAIFEVHSLKIRFHGETHIFNLNEIVLVVGLLAVSPSDLVLAEIIGAGLVLGLYSRLPPLKLAFNCAQFACSTAAAAVVFRMIADPAAPFGPRTWLAVLIAVTVAAAIGQIAITAAIVVTQGRVRRTGIVESQIFGMASAIVNTMLGLVAAIVLADSAYGLALLIGPVVVVFVAYRAYLSERTKRAGLEFLYSASEVLNSARDLEGGLVNLLDFARDTFHAEVAELTLRGEGGAEYSSRVGPGNAIHALAPASGSDSAAVLEAAAHATEAIIVCPVAGSALAERDGFACGSVLVAALNDDSGIRGAVLVARGTTSDPFEKEELQLFETFANHLGTTLEKARLNTSLAQLREAKQELAYQAYHDSLTGLANRSLFAERVDDALEHAGETGARVAVLFIDLDDFKTINDTMGHAAGDALLEEVGRRIEASIGENDTAARLGGDEFAVLLPSAAEGEARAAAERILVALGDPVEVEGQPVVTQASIGIAWQGSAADASELMQHADVAMYTAKRDGKGRFSEFEPTMSLSVEHRHRMKVGLERALANDELVVHYQPVIEVATGELVALEALVRWKDPTRGMRLPTEFVGVAEDTGLIVPIGRLVLQEACRQAAQWSALQPDLRVFVNLSARQLADSEVVADVCAALANSGLRPEQLQLEVTETAMVEDIEHAADMLDALKSIGVGVAIDDFGTGFSSLSYLRQLPIDVLKIAKPIIDTICISDADAAFVRGIVELGHVVGMKVIAEGVEQVEQYARLVEMGCDFLQGYYYAFAMEPNEVAHILASAVPVPPIGTTTTYARTHR